MFCIDSLISPVNLTMESSPLEKSATLVLMCAGKFYHVSISSSGTPFLTNAVSVMSRFLILALPKSLTRARFWRTVPTTSQRTLVRCATWHPKVRKFVFIFIDNCNPHILKHSCLGKDIQRNSRYVFLQHSLLANFCD